jgi:hypothetical protein
MSNRMLVECRDCTFEKLVEIDGDPEPAEILLAHEDETGHRLRLAQSDEKGRT